MIAWIQLYKCNSIKSFLYISSFYKKLLSLISKKHFIRKFYQLKQSDFVRLGKYELNFKTESTNWPYIPTSFREYQNINQYILTPSNRACIIEQRLKSQKIPQQCDIDCICMKDELTQTQQFCKYSVLNGWQTSCPNRLRKVECNHKQKQKIQRCRNAEISKKQRKKCRIIKQQQNNNNNSNLIQCQIQQCITWGFDLYSRNFIYHCLPQIDINNVQRFDNIQNRNNFIQKSLSKAINFNGKQGYSIEKACNFILKNSPKIKRFNKMDAQTFKWKQQQLLKQQQQQQINSNNNLFTIKDSIYCQLLLRNYNLCSNKQAFRIHTKGKGAKCIKKQGIKQGRFIIQYYGEIYQPWHWYQKQDFIKQIMKKKNHSKFIPQFYNIYLQKHKDQPLGYDILIVDPIKKGNFSSRFSHSCDPNCGTISTVSNGKYYIGMYSFKNIQFGQELTFDYCSTTQSKYQHINTICLCGKYNCRGNYLELTNTKLSNNSMENNSCFLNRNSLILQSTNQLTKQDQQICNKYNIKKGILHNTPKWIIKWIVYCLESIEKEIKQYGINLRQGWSKFYLQKNEQIEIKQKNIEMFTLTSTNDLFVNRYQNLITTVDKLKYFLSSINSQNLPIEIINSKHLLFVLIDGQNSILLELQDILFEKHYQKESNIIEYFIKQISKENEIKIKLFLFRLCCLIISTQILLFKNQNKFNYCLLSDIIYFYSFTHTYFIPNQYKMFLSQQICISIQQILGQQILNKYKNCQKNKKKYTSPFIWGQLVSWFKQTIKNPQASLSQDRRGTLTYPTLKSIMQKLKKNIFRLSTYPFDKHRRKNFLKIIREKPANSWPPSQGCDLSFRNLQKCYGTIFFESVHSSKKLKFLSKQNLLDTCLDVINNSLNDKLIIFKQVQWLLQEIPQNSQIYNNIIENLNINFNLIPSQQLKNFQIQIQSKKKNKFF